MSETSWELIRSKLQDRDHIELAIMSILEAKSKMSNTILADHKLKSLQNQARLKTLNALELLQNFDEIREGSEPVSTGGRSKESEGLSLEKGNVSGPSREINGGQRGEVEDFIFEIEQIEREFTASRLQSLEAGDETPQNFAERALEAPYEAPVFSAGEVGGRAVDLEGVFAEFAQAEVIKRAGLDTYFHFLRDFDKLFEIPEEDKRKNHKGLFRLFEKVLAYLKDFFARTQPLADAEEISNEVERELEKLDPSEELFCPVCATFFSNPNTFLAHKSGAKHLKNLSKDSRPPEPQNTRRVSLPKLEAATRMYKSLLEEAFDYAVNTLRAKMTRAGNLEEELQEAEGNPDDDEEEEEEENKGRKKMKKLPIGQDGKPMTFWAFKAQGLNVEYTCEICGNYSYWGRKAFEKHFTEWRHTYGMRSLKIPNTPHFREITGINEALQLHEKLLKEAKKFEFVPDNEQEFEDNEGNLLKKREYEDLKRQQIL